LPDLREDDIAGSGFAITGYTVHKNLGGAAALARLRERLRNRGPRLMLDVRLPFADLAGKKWLLRDQLRTTSYDRNGDDLHGRGLFLDMAPWKTSVFSLVERD
ncbi:MAG: hypothetical protein ACHQ50_15120, partial [Fimbriimonadales bacterium]